MDKLAASQNEGRVSLADQDRMTQIIQQLNIDQAQYEKLINPEDDGNAELQHDLAEFTQVHHGKKWKEVPSKDPIQVPRRLCPENLASSAAED